MMSGSKERRRVVAGDWEGGVGTEEEQVRIWSMASLVDDSLWPAPNLLPRQVQRYYLTLHRSQFSVQIFHCRRYPVLWF